MVRHPKRSIRNAATGGVSAAPRRPPLKYTPKDVERSATGTHRVKAAAVAGDRAASSVPNVNRTASIERKPHTAPVSAVNPDQQKIAAVMMPRDPKRSASIPQGACAVAYARKKMLKTKPNCACDNPSSLRIRGPATAMQTRSV